MHEAGLNLLDDGSEADRCPDIPVQGGVLNEELRGWIGFRIQAGERQQKEQDRSPQPIRTGYPTTNLHPFLLLVRMPEIQALARCVNVGAKPVLSKRANWAVATRRVWCKLRGALFGKSEDQAR